jgi:hypothetical protein
MFQRSQRYQAGEVMSSGKYKRHDKFNPVQIKDGQVVRLNKNGTVRSILGALKDMKKDKK